MLPQMLRERGPPTLSKGQGSGAFEEVRQRHGRSDDHVDDVQGVDEPLVPKRSILIVDAVLDTPRTVFVTRARAVLGAMRTSGTSGARLPWSCAWGCP